jgi:hypothetical protein
VLGVIATLVAWSSKSYRRLTRAVEESEAAEADGAAAPAPAMGA